MITATDDDLSTRTRGTRKDGSVADAVLFALIDELRECEKRREDLLNRLSIEDGDDQTAGALKAACDIAMTIYSRIAAMKPTTVAGVLCQLELAASGWVAPSTVPIAMAGLREIANRPPPLKVGRLPPAPPMSSAFARFEVAAGAGPA